MCQTCAIVTEGTRNSMTCGCCPFARSEKHNHFNHLIFKFRMCCFVYSYFNSFGLYIVSRHNYNSPPYLYYIPFGFCRSCQLADGKKSLLPYTITDWLLITTLYHHRRVNRQKELRRQCSDALIKTCAADEMDARNRENAQQQC
jgi:hypothetical protein